LVRPGEYSYNAIVLNKRPIVFPVDILIKRILIKKSVYVIEVLANTQNVGI